MKCRRRDRKREAPVLPATRPVRRRDPIRSRSIEPRIRFGEGAAGEGGSCCLVPFSKARRDELATKSARCDQRPYSIRPGFPPSTLSEYINIYSLQWLDRRRGGSRGGGGRPRWGGRLRSRSIFGRRVIGYRLTACRDTSVRACGSPCLPGSA